MFEVILKGLAAGFIVAVPLGPVSLLCFRRVLMESRIVGLVTVFGAALADMLYGLAAATGLSAVTHLLLSHKEPLRIGGGFFLLYLGIRMFRSRETAPEKDIGARNLAGTFFAAFLLMLANPTIIISFLAVFAALDLSAIHPGFQEALWLGVSLFAGSSGWWLVYKLTSWKFGPKLKEHGLRAINVATGCLICAFGLWQLAQVVLNR